MHPINVWTNSLLLSQLSFSMCLRTSQESERCPLAIFIYCWKYCSQLSTKAQGSQNLLLEVTLNIRRLELFLIFHLSSFESRARLWPQVPAGVCEAGGGRRPAVGCESWTSLSWRHTTKHSQAGARAAAADQ